MMATDAGRCVSSSSSRGGRGDRGLVLSRHERVRQRDVFVQGNEGARGDKSKNEVAVLIEERCLSTAPLPQSARRACPRPAARHPTWKPGRLLPLLPPLAGPAPPYRAQQTAGHALTEFYAL